MNVDDIDASPTKKLFIDILTRDIKLEACILDLVDNSIDAYTRNNFEELKKIELTITPEKFEIYDNCGGIEEKFLREHVFRFGVTELVRDIPTLGVYGIGLKRSLFKIGGEFILETDDQKTYCIVKVDVKDWEKNDDWTLPFEKSESKLNKGELPYTKITINKLHEEVKKQFSLSTFINNLRDKIGVIYTMFLGKKVDIIVNSKPIVGIPLNIRYSDKYAPTVYKDKVNDVDVKIICFIQPRKNRGDPMIRRGWNFFCNDRLILMDDMTSKTGWDGTKAHLPQYHPIYNEFRGIVRLTSKDPSKLPLNTTKTGLIYEHDTYKKVLDLMIINSRPLINFLTKKYNSESNQLEEIENSVEEEIDEVEEENITEVPVQEVEEETTFSAPEPKPQEERAAGISYEKPKKIVNKLKKYLKVKTNKAVGEKTFDYFVEMENLNE